MKRLSFILAILSSIMPLVGKAETATYECSGTLPVLYITTDSLKNIDSKDYYLNATYYLDPNGVKGVKAIGTPELPDTMQIKGRGNATWKLDKKPYRIKLNKKTGLLGMPKSKHFALLAHYDDYSGAFLNDETGFELSRRFKMAFTPQQQPAEVVLNNEYIGIYFVTQNVRVGSDRVNITEQDDNDTNPDNVSGGWLLERDNTQQDNQIVTRFGRITYHSPEELSTEQDKYITNFFSTLYKQMFTTDKSDNSWEEMVDIDSLARFYMINEIMDDIEAFTGSCYMHKDRGDSSKLIFGPVWDFGRSLERVRNDEFHMTYEEVPSYINVKLVMELLKFPHFRKVIRQIWTDEIEEIRNGLDDKIMAWGQNLEASSQYEKHRWPNSQCGNTTKSAATFMSNLNARMDWLDDIWNLNKLYDINNDKLVDVEDINILLDVILTPGTVTRKTTDINFDGPTDVDDLNKLIDKILYH